MAKITKIKGSVFHTAIFGIIGLLVSEVGIYYLLSFWSNKSPSHNFVVFYLFFASIIFIVILFFHHILKSITTAIENELEIKKNSFDLLNNTYEGTLKALSYTLDIRDHGTWGHSARVISYALAIAKAMGLKEDELRQLAWAGLLHDIGKIGIPDVILFKTAELNQEEWENIKRHPQIGYKVIKEIDFLKFAADIVLSHHEHYDGSGYPRGLQGEQIPLAARIFAIADALDAMTSTRPYHTACTMAEAFTEIRNLAYSQFCPKCIKAVEKIGIDALTRIQQNVRDIGDVANIRNILEPFEIFDQSNIYLK